MPRSKESKACLHDRVLNPSSGRCVIKSGRIGKRLLSQSNSKPSKSSKATNPKPPRDCASDKIVNPSSGRCVKKSGRIGKVLLNGERPEGTSASSADALLVATERLLKRIGKRVGDLQPPKSMLLKMSQVNRIRKKQLVLPVVAPQDYDKATMLTAFSEDISEDFLHDAELGKVTTSTWGLEITGTNTQFVKLDEMIHFTNKYEEHKRNIRDLARQTCLNQYSTGYTHVTVGDGHMSCYNSMLDGSGAKMISESNWTYNEQPNTNFWITKHYGRVRSE